MDILVLVVFVYAGIVLGEVPGLALDRSGIALLGAIAILAIGGLSLEDALTARRKRTCAFWEAFSSRTEAEARRRGPNA